MNSFKTLPLGVRIIKVTCWWTCIKSFTRIALMLKMTSKFSRAPMLSQQLLSKFNGLVIKSFSPGGVFGSYVVLTAISTQSTVMFLLVIDLLDNVLELLPLNWVLSIIQAHLDLVIVGLFLHYYGLFEILLVLMLGWYELRDQLILFLDQFLLYIVENSFSRLLEKIILSSEPLCKLLIYVLKMLQFLGNAWEEQGLLRVLWIRPRIVTLEPLNILMPAHWERNFWRKLRLLLVYREERICFCKTCSFITIGIINQMLTYDWVT